MKSPLYRASRRTALVAACLPALAGAPAAIGDQILQIDGGCLTSVKYTSVTAGQGLRPLALQSGVGIDGTLRAGGGYRWALNANPFEPGVGGANLGSVRLATGTYSPTFVQFSLPAPGSSGVTIGVTYNQRQEASGSLRS
jgi:hypothetical protein